MNSQLSKEVRERANNVCQFCREHCETLEAHHQVKGDDSSLIAICPNCHRWEHRKPLALARVLREMLNGLSLNKKKFIMFRIASIDTGTAEKLCKLTRGTYNSWFKDDTFNSIYKQMPELQRKFESVILQELERQYALEALVIKFKKQGDIRD
jgi:hypothetical protein